MDNHWIVYDLATGAALYPGSGTAGTATAQQLPEGTGMLIVPWAVLRPGWNDLDLGALREALAAGVDAQAEAVRQSILTPGSGQAMTYARKEAEARAWAVGDSAPTPFLSAEAPARGMTIAELAAEVIRLADAWVAVGAVIEGLRMGAKARMASASTFAEIVLAGQIDWSGLSAPAA